MAETNPEQAAVKHGFFSLIPSRDILIKFVVQTTIGAVASVGGNLTYERAITAVAILYAWAIEHYFILGLLLGCIVILLLGVALFWVRGRFPIVYGSTEVFVGIIAAINAFTRVDFSTVPDAGVVIQILGGIYIIVRGLDNMGKGVKGTALEPRWNGWFAQR